MKFNPANGSGGMLHATACSLRYLSMHSYIHTKQRKRLAVTVCLVAESFFSAFILSVEHLKSLNGATRASSSSTSSSRRRPCDPSRPRWRSSRPRCDPAQPDPYRLHSGHQENLPAMWILYDCLSNLVTTLC